MRSRPSIVPALFATAIACLAGTPPAQAGWSLLSPPNAPGAREDHDLVHDSVTQRSYLLHGTRNGTGATDPFWQWDGTNWTAMTAGSSALLWTWGRGATCDEGTGTFLMFGGYRPGIGIGGGQPIVLDQTWRIQPTGPTTLFFTLLSPAVSPSARQGARMVRTNQGLVLFGGMNVAETTFLADAWRWDGTTWTQLAGGPPARAQHAMAFDAARGVVVLFGGRTNSSTTVNDTWEFDGTAWMQRAPAQSPPPRCRAATVWSPTTGLTLVFAGSAANGTQPRNDLWGWNGSTWLPIAVPGTPSPRRGAAFVHHAATQHLVLFGGSESTFVPLADTNTLGLPAAVAAYTPFGTGCLGPNGLVPALAAPPNETPSLGTTSHLRVTNLPLGLTLPVFVLGTSNTFQQGSPGHALPFDLGFLGWPGCAQLVSHDVMEAIPTLTGEASYAFAVPPTLTVLGFTFHAQVLALYVPTGAATSNALTGQVGW